MTKPSVIVLGFVMRGTEAGIWDSLNADHNRVRRLGRGHRNQGILLAKSAIGGKVAPRGTGKQLRHRTITRIRVEGAALPGDARRHFYAVGCFVDMHALSFRIQDRRIPVKQFSRAVL